MQTNLPEVPGADVPLLPPAEMRRRWIMKRARVSEHAVDLLIALALGPRDDEGWPSVAVEAEAREVAYA